LIIFVVMLFSEVIGQAETKELLISSMKEGRVSHALLFFGNAGSGVLPMALAFAQYINCESPSESDSCGKCGSCLRSMKMVHPDIHYSYPFITTSDFSKPKAIDYVAQWREAVLSNPYLPLIDWLEILNEGELKSKQGFISVEEANDIIRKISLKSFEGKYKVVIIWLPEKLRTDSANKLLKSLEEPPDNTIFILASEQRDVLLPTILSRTQLIKLSRLKDEIVIDALVNNCSLSETAAKQIAFLVEGNYTEAVRLANLEVNESGHETQFLNWMRLSFNPTRTMVNLLTWVDEAAGKSKEDQKQFLIACIRMVRECVLMNAQAKDLVKLEPNQLVALERFLPFVTQYNAHDFMKVLDDAIYHIERNAYAKILFLDLSLKLSKILKMNEAPKAVH
jgi:DNA polymerase III subunit delta'